MWADLTYCYYFSHFVCLTFQLPWNKLRHFVAETASHFRILSVFVSSHKTKMYNSLIFIWYLECIGISCGGYHLSVPENSCDEWWNANEREKIDIEFDRKISFYVSSTSKFLLYRWEFKFLVCPIFYYYSNCILKKENIKMSSWDVLFENHRAVVPFSNWNTKTRFFKVEFKKKLLVVRNTGWALSMF